MYRDLSDAEFVKRAELYVEVLDPCLRNVPGNRVRMHVCWGNYEGPHTRDIALQAILPVLLNAKPRALLFEGPNPRHAHEWSAWTKVKVPDDYVLVPGCLDSTTNFVEHPELVAELDSALRGHRRAGAGDGGDRLRVLHLRGLRRRGPEIAWARLAALVEGAAVASRRLGAAPAAA